MGASFRLELSLLRVDWTSLRLNFYLLLVVSHVTVSEATITCTKFFSEFFIGCILPIKVAFSERLYPF
jgi:hypothetical protein